MGAYDWAVEAYLASESPAARFVAFDLETTGLEPRQHRIVEIGAVKFDRRGPIGRFSVLIDPGVPMPPDASRVNGITDAMLAGRPTLDAVLPDFLRFVGDGVLVAHNSGFDCSFVNAALAARWRDPAAADAQGSLLAALDETPDDAGPTTWRAPFPALPHRVVDTLAFAKQVFPGRPRYKLQDLAASLGIDAREAHRAEDDARVCMELFVKCTEAFSGTISRSVR